MEKDKEYEIKTPGGIIVVTRTGPASLMIQSVARDMHTDDVKE